MMFMPAWYWDECRIWDDIFYEKKEYDWVYHLHEGMGSVDDIKDLPENYNIDFPTEYSAFIEVIYEKDGPYFDYDGWITI